jgi:hypothetical protein
MIIEGKAISGENWGQIPVFVWESGKEEEKEFPYVSR